MHALYTLLYLAIFVIFVKKYSIKSIITMFFIIILTNINIYNELSINDFTYSIFSNISIISLYLLMLIIFKQTRCIDFKGSLFVFCINLIFLLAYLNIISVDIYSSFNVIALMIVCLIAYFINKNLALIYLFALFLSMFVINKFNLFFDILSLFISFIFIIIRAKNN